MGLHCAYIRLSEEDLNKSKDFSESIINQIELIEEYARKNDIHIDKKYIDEGYSGINFCRPAFTGFFAKIPYYNDLLNVLITNNHVLGESDIADGKNITISLNNETIIKDIILDSNRKRYTNNILDVTIIEIREKEDNINDFLLLDKQIINLINKKSNTNNDKFLNNLYENESIYLLNYMNGEKIFSSYGLLKEIQQDEIYHQCCTDLGSSGSPILLLKNNQVIGVHFGTKKNIVFNLGTLLVKPYSRILTQLLWH